MYILHYAPDNASMIIRLVLESAGLAYRTVLVDRRKRQQDSAAYRTLNPAGLIPTLETDFGPISETAAILLWLADTHDLAPDPRHPDRPALLQWLFFLSNTAHADLRKMFYPDRFVPESATIDHHNRMATRMRQHFRLLDTAAAQHPVLFAPSGLLAPYVCTLMRWSVLYPRGQSPWFTLSEFPTLQVVARALEATGAARSVAAAEGLSAHPFTVPVHPDPPEGSAT